MSRAVKIALAIAGAIVILVGCIVAWRRLHPRYTSETVILIEGQKPPSGACTSEQEQKAEAEADDLTSWELVYASFVSYESCDDGAIAEGYSDSISHLLADEWQKFDELNQLTREHTPFREFVLRHIDESMSSEQAKAIAENAHSHCPPTGQALCGEILQRLNFK